LNVDDRIDLILSTEVAELSQAITEHADTIQTETLAVSLSGSGKKPFETTVSVDGYKLGISLSKV